jgi:hypothetical protein
MSDEKNPKTTSSSNQLLPKFLRDDSPTETAAPEARGPRYLEPNRGRAKKAKRHEKNLAKSVGGRRLPASGALPFSRRDRNTAAADVRSDSILYQHKGTERDSLGVQRDWLFELCIEAKRRSLDPALVILFEKETRCPKEWVAVPMEVFQRLLANQGQGE